jgi:hypothetical protein
MTEALVRLLVGLTVAVAGGLARLLLLVVRLVLWLLALVGFRGARLAGLAATVAGVWWAAATVGPGPVVRLVVIGWAAWAARHHRAAIRQTAAVRRLATAQQAAVRTLTAALRQHTEALAAAKSGSVSSSRTTTTPTDGEGPAVLPWQAADQRPDRAVAAVGRYAAAWVRRHAAPAREEPR